MYGMSTHHLCVISCMACQLIICVSYHVWHVNSSSVCHQLGISPKYVHAHERAVEPTLTPRKPLRITSVSPLRSQEPFVVWFPNQEPAGRGSRKRTGRQEEGRKRTPLAEPPKNWSILGVVLQVGSSSYGFLIWKPPNKENHPGGGFFRSTYACHESCW